MTDVTDFQALESSIKQVIDAETEDFFEIAKIIGLDPLKDLAGANLSATNLSQGNLSKANLLETDLCGANLRGADLSDADLRGANLRGADLSDADLRGADLRGTNLSNTNVKNAQFGDGLGLSEHMRFELKQRGANLKDSPVESDYPRLLNQVILRFEDEFKEHREDVSAILLTPDQHLWLGSDETSTIERLSFVDSQTFAEHKQFRVAEFIELPESEDKEIDVEGLAYTDHYLWFIGSHSWKRKRPKPYKTDVENIERLTKITSEANRYLLGRIPFVNGELLPSCPHPYYPNEQLSAAKLEVTKLGNVLMDALRDDPHLGFFVGAEVPGKENGFDIEGIAVYQDRIFLGLRGPVLRGWAVILEIQLETSDLGLLKLKQVEQGKQYKKHFVYLNGLGIRDLCLDGEDLLILAGPTMDLDGPVRVYRLNNGVNLHENVLSKPYVVLDIPYGNGEEHAEGMTLFNDINQIPSLLVVYDSPAKRRLEGDGEVIADVFNLGEQKNQPVQTRGSSLQESHFL